MKDWNTEKYLHASEDCKKNLFFLKAIFPSHMESFNWKTNITEVVGSYQNRCAYIMEVFDF